MNTLFSPEILQAGAVKGLRRGRVGLEGMGVGWWWWEWWGSEEKKESKEITGTCVHLLESQFTIDSCFN